MERKICAYSLYFGKCWLLLKTRCLLTSVNVIICHLFLLICQLPAWFYIQSLVDDSKGLTGVYFPFLRPEKMAKLPVILGNLDVTIDNVAPDLTSKPSKFTPCIQHEKRNLFLRRPDGSRCLLTVYFGFPPSCFCI